jgi:hypothetical protein
MSQQNKTTLQSAINTQLADNTTGDISAADVRNNLINITDSLLFNSGSQGLTGSLTVTNNITASGDLRFTTAGNSVVRPIIDLTVNGTASYSPNSTNTTAYADYGINLITSSNATSYCLRLPQTPVKGKLVTLINNSGINVVVFPSVVGGSINGIVNGYITLPSDGKSYSFDCYENPLPGGWSMTSPQLSTTTINTGVINFHFSQSISRSLAYVSDNIKAYGNNTATIFSTYGTLNSLPKYEAYPSINPFTGYVNAIALILPDSPAGVGVWECADSVIIQTNITTSLIYDFNFSYNVGAGCRFYYNPNNPSYNSSNPIPVPIPNSYYYTQEYLDFSSTIVDPWFATHLGATYNVGQISAVSGYGGTYTYNIVPGTFTPSIASPYTSDNIGDPGTFGITISNFPLSTNPNLPGFAWFGNNFIGTLYSSTYGMIDLWYTNQLQPRLVGPSINSGIPNIPNIKFITTYTNVQI